MAFSTTIDFEKKEVVRKSNVRKILGLMDGGLGEYDTSENQVKALDLLLKTNNLPCVRKEGDLYHQTEHTGETLCTIILAICKHGTRPITPHELWQKGSALLEGKYLKEVGYKQNQEDDDDNDNESYNESGTESSQHSDYRAPQCTLRYRYIVCSVLIKSTAKRRRVSKAASSYTRPKATAAQPTAVRRRLPTDKSRHHRQEEHINAQQKRSLQDLENKHNPKDKPDTAAAQPKSPESRSTDSSIQEVPSSVAQGGGTDHEQLVSPISEQHVYEPISTKTTALPTQLIPGLHRIELDYSGVSDDMKHINKLMSSVLGKFFKTISAGEDQHVHYVPMLQRGTALQHLYEMVFNMPSDKDKPEKVSYSPTRTAFNSLLAIIGAFLFDRVFNSTAKWDPAGSSRFHSHSPRVQRIYKRISMENFGRQPYTPS